MINKMSIETEDVRLPFLITRDRQLGRNNPFEGLAKEIMNASPSPQLRQAWLMC